MPVLSPFLEYLISSLLSMVSPTLLQALEAKGKVWALQELAVLVGSNVIGQEVVSLVAAAWGLPVPPAKAAG